MNAKPQLHNVVALMQDLPDEGLVQGQVGTVVELLDEQNYEIEFSDDEGRAYAMLPLRGEQLIILHHAPVPTL